VISQQERNKLIRQISQASGVAQYALVQKMTDEQIIEAAKHLKIFQLIKPANNYNRYCQSQKTSEANNKLKEFIDLKNSEIVKAGQWLLNSFSKQRSERKQALLEKDLVHKEDYNETVLGMRDTITTMQGDITDAFDDAQNKIVTLEQRIDTLKSQLSQIQQYISNNYGVDKWKTIKDTFKIY
jgi:hypothetical protein